MSGKERMEIMLPKAIFVKGPVNLWYPPAYTLGMPRISIPLKNCTYPSIAKNATTVDRQIRMFLLELGLFMPSLWKNRANSP